MTYDKRQASNGLEGLLLSEHHENSGVFGSSRSADPSSTADPLMSGRSQQISHRHSTGSVLGNPTDPVMETYSSSSASFGEVGTFRSKALARRWVNSSRRNLLRQQPRMSDASLVTNETTALTSSIGKDSIPEDRPVEQPSADAGTMAVLKDIIFGKLVSVFLLLIPLAFWSHYGGWGANYVFWLNFLVMIPLAAILGDFTEEAALHTNETIGGLLNATFGNAVEVVVAIQALLANEIRVVQASMIGSIFSNLLLVLGCCFFFGGLKYKEQSFNATAATANMGLLALSSIALVLPTPFADYYQVEDEHVLIISRVAAFFLLFMYIQLLVFQLYTHAHIFEAKEKTEEEKDGDEEDIEEEVPRISMTVALIGLCLTTLSVTVFSDFLVESIDEFCISSGISKTFVGLIILPIVGNAVEHITAVTVAMKNKMDLAMGGKCRTSRPRQTHFSS
jgi:Ca2+:H+ antiporter